MPRMPVYHYTIKKFRSLRTSIIVQNVTPIWCSRSSNGILILLLTHPNPSTSLFELSECYELNVPYVHLFWKCPLHLVVQTELGSFQGHCFLLKGWLYYYFCLIWIDSGYGGEWSILNHLLLISSSNTFLLLPFSKKHLLERTHQNIPLLTFLVLISQPLGHSFIYWIFSNIFLFTITSVIVGNFTIHLANLSDTLTAPLDELLLFAKASLLPQHGILPARTHENDSCSYLLYSAFKMCPLTTGLFLSAVIFLILIM